ncbi:MAG: hypothetical protein WBC04_25265 [Candidatus Acidiferrales bacterium]
MMRHPRKFYIADEEAVKVLINKLHDSGHKQLRRERLLQALEDASRHYRSTSENNRRAFFHGLLTGYAVALKLW